MRFTVTISVPRNQQSTPDPLTTVATRLDEAGFPHRAVGQALEVSGEWGPIMDLFHDAYTTLREQVPSVSFSMTADEEAGSAEEASAARSEAIAERDSFPASDPPGTNPGRS